MFKVSLLLNYYRFNKKWHLPSGRIRPVVKQQDQSTFPLKMDLQLLRAFFEQWKQRTVWVPYEPENSSDDEDLGDLCYESSGYAVGTHYPYRSK